MTSTCAVLIFCGIFYIVAGREHGPGHDHANNPMRQKFMESRDECLKQYDSTVSKNDVMKIFHSQNDADVNVDQDMKCFFECFTKKMGSMDDKGNIIVPEPKDKNGKPHYMAKAFDVCKNVEGDDTCDKAYNFQKCLSKNRPPRPHPHNHNHPSN